MTTSPSQTRLKDTIVCEASNDAPPINPYTGWNFRLRLIAALAIPIFLETLDYTVVATAQPHIASTFNRLDLQSWIGTSYLLTATVFLPLFASVANAFGRHAAIQISLVFFVIGSAVSTGAASMVMMLVGRGVAGVGAGGLVAVIRIIMADARSLDENNFQSVMFIILYAAGFTLGPLIGGALIGVSYRWVFALNLPCAIICMFLVYVLLGKRLKGPQNGAISERLGIPEREFSLSEKLLSIDFFGAFLFVSGVILFLLALTWGPDIKWNTLRVILCFTLGGTLVIASLVWEWCLDRYGSRKGTTSTPLVGRIIPMLPIPVFQRVDVVVCQFAGFVGGMVLFVCFYFVAIFFTIVSGDSARKAGVDLLWFSPGIGTGVCIATTLISKLRQPKLPIMLGGVVLPVALGLISMAINSNKPAQIKGFMLLAGVGVGLTFGPLSIQARFKQPESRIAIVEALITFFTNLGGTISLALCATVMNTRVNRYLSDLVSAGTVSTADAKALSQLSSGSIASIQAINALPPDVAAQVREAFRQGTRWAFISLVPWAAAAFVASLFLSELEESDFSPKTETPELEAAASESKLVETPDEKKDLYV